MPWRRSLAGLDSFVDFTVRHIEGVHTAKQLIRDNAEGELVASGVESLSVMLLGRHVSGGTCDGTRRRCRARNDRAKIGFLPLVGARPFPKWEHRTFRGARFSCQTKIGYAHPSVVSHEYIGGLEVAVDEPRVVGGDEPRGSLQEYF